MSFFSHELFILLPFHLLAFREELSCLITALCFLLGRPVQTCLITGQPAPYLDPRSAVPFANIHAYQTLTKLLHHDYAWNESLGCYTSYDPIPVDVQVAALPTDTIASLSSAKAIGNAANN